MGQSRRHQHRSGHHAPGRRKPPNRTRVELVHEEPGNHDGPRQGGGEIASASSVQLPASGLQLRASRFSPQPQLALIEYGVRRLLAGPIIGLAGSIAVTWAMTAYGNIRVPWHFHPAINI